MEIEATSGSGKVGPFAVQWKQGAFGGKRGLRKDHQGLQPNLAGSGWSEAGMVACHAGLEGRTFNVAATEPSVIPGRFHGGNALNY